MTCEWRTSTTRPGNGPGIPKDATASSRVRPPNEARQRQANQPSGEPAAKPAAAPINRPRRVMPQQPGVPNMGLSSGPDTSMVTNDAANCQGHHFSGCLFLPNMTVKCGKFLNVSRQDPSAMNTTNE